MRKAQKEQAESFIRLLGQAHDEIKRAIDKGNDATALELLEQCQDGAIQLGNLIEATEGEGFVTIPSLEQYCELVYEIHGEILQGQGASGNKAYKNLRKALIKIENSVRNDIRIRTEAVFLPYKASMWDSLESVWRAADADPDCDAYVIPIPYYDRNQDGSFGELHYEGSQYPKYVPVTWYQDYDFEKRRPDMVFIHNPYDDCNYVTSVHPSFYSSNLKQYTDKLVYIPYFILGEVDPQDKSAIDGIEHFITVPAVFNADKVIVQSEDMRKVYIEVLAKATGESGRSKWREKILGTGSPKIDKVLNTDRQEMDIPAPWLRLIERPDGSRKKVIFYNTSVVALLEHGERMLDKIKDVLGTFRKKRDDFILLWRPHPLMKATMESMRPGLWRQYEQIVDTFRVEKWGIYDDTADLDRAIALCDAYYGDSSSVVCLFQNAGKQAMVQNVYLKNNVDHSITAAEAVTYVDGKYWYIPYWDNILCCMDERTFQSQIMAVFSDSGKSGLYAEIVHYKGRLFCVPRNADMMIVYHIENREMRQIAFSDGDNDVCNGSKFGSHIVKGHILYLIPCKYHSVVAVDMESDLVEEYRIHHERESRQISIGNAAAKDGAIYFSCKEEACLIRLDTKKKTVEKVIPAGEKRVYSNLFCIDQRLWLIPFEVREGIRVWNEQADTFEEILDFPREILEQTSESITMRFPDVIADEIRNRNVSYFKRGILHNGNIHLPVNLTGKNVVIFTREKRIACWDVEPDCFEAAMYTWMRSLRILSYFQAADDLYAVSGISGQWYRFDGDRWERVRESVSVMENDNKILVLDGKAFCEADCRHNNHAVRAGETIYTSLSGEWKRGKLSQ